MRRKWTTLAGGIKVAEFQNIFLRPRIVEGLAAKYQQIFEEDPWGQKNKCPMPGCGYMYGDTEGNLCPHYWETKKIRISLVPCWRKETVIPAFLFEMQQRKAHCHVAVYRGEIIGFCWWYEIVSGPQMDATLEVPGIHQLLHGRFTFLSTIVVEHKYRSDPSTGKRGAGVGKELMSRFLKKATPNRIVLCTLKGSPMYDWMCRLGAKVIWETKQDGVVMRM